jgi:hypothetical protein
VPVIEEKIDAVLLGLDGVIQRARAELHELGDRQLEAAGGACVGAHLTRHGDGAFDGQGAECLPALGRDRGANDDGLHRATSVAHDDEGNFSGRT